MNPTADTAALMLRERLVAAGDAWHYAAIDAVNWGNHMKLRSTKANSIHIGKFHSEQSGVSAIETTLLMCVAIIILIALTTIIVERPPNELFAAALVELSNKGILIVLVGGLVGLAAWFGKQSSVTINNQAQLRILEILSAGQPHTREELRRLLRKEKFVHKLFPELHLDALATLVNTGKVIPVENGKYALAQHPSSSLSSSAQKPNRIKRGRS